MKHVFYAFVWIMLSWGTASAQSGNYAGLHKKIGWLVGKWGFTAPEGSLTETWILKNDSTYAGETCFVIGKDTVFSEKLTVEQRGNDIHYVTLMKDRNEGKPVAFKLTSANKKELVLENPAHDFPQKITYTKSGANAVVAEISGIQKGKPASEKFPMEKLK